MDTINTQTKSSINYSKTYPEHSTDSHILNQVGDIYSALRCISPTFAFNRFNQLLLSYRENMSPTYRFFSFHEKQRRFGELIDRELLLSTKPFVECVYDTGKQKYFSVFTRCVKVYTITPDFSTIKVKK